MNLDRQCANEGKSARGPRDTLRPMLRRTTVLVPALVCASLLASVHPVFAQDPMALMRRELNELREEVMRLRAEVNALKQVAPEAPGTAQPQPSPAVEMLQTQIAELAQTKVESTTRLPLKIFGTVHAGVFANSGNANWLDNPNLVSPPTPLGHPGTMSASLRQTRIGLTADGPTLGSVRTNAVVAMDFFGGIPAFQTGQVMGLPRLLVAFARIEGERTALEVGQDHMILAPRDPTSLAAYAFPLLFRSGNLYLRTPQVRIEQSFASRLRATAGIVAPIGGDLTDPNYVFVPPALGGERSQRPGVQARFAYTTGEADSPRHVDIGVSGHVGWERRADDLARSWASAIDFAARRDVIGVAGEFFTGDNIDAFGGALGLDARSAGGWGELQLFPTTRLSFATGFGLDDVQDANRFSLARRQNQSVYGNVMFSLTPEVQASFEYRWLKTFAGDISRPNHHFDWVLVHRF
jgi:hypothetical protein